MRCAAARRSRTLLTLDRADVLAARADRGELFWGGAIPFYDTHKQRLLGEAPIARGQEAVAALYADVDHAVPSDPLSSIG